METGMEGPPAMIGGPFSLKEKLRAGDLGAVTILLADDNEDSREIYRTLFEMAGFRVLLAGDGLSVLSVVEKEKPDLILLNLLMPQLDGHGVLTELRGDPETEEIPCLVFTGDARFATLGRAMKNGADAFLTKPAEPMMVLRFVQELLGSQGQEGGTVTP
jgi:two-component system phosphate regulon response regulator PhoB